MISNKVGVQDFSKATQRHDFGDNQNVHYQAATPEVKSDKVDKNMRPGDKNLGDQLNDIANPGGNTEANKAKRKAHNTLDKDDFLKLMLTQMKNQDPMNPMQSHEMAAQLAQFTSLEQLFNVNKNLEGLTRAQDPMQKYEALNFLGRTIKADSRQILRQPGDQATELRFNLMGDAAKIKLTIADENGAVVKTVEFGNLKKGPNKLAWAGTDNENRDVKPGKYMFNVEAENGGKKIGVLTETKGTITGVNYTPEGPMLMVGDQKVRLQDVQKIEDEGLKTKQNDTEAPAAAALNKDGKPMTAEDIAAEAAAKPIVVKPETKMASNFDERMSGEIIPQEGSAGNATGLAPKFRKP
jgi:flagellar basal-body rod modification protein FlgD